MFGDIDMRARMNRLGGFDWGGHKRHGSGFPDTEHFFKNDFHQFPGFSNPMDAFNRAKSGAQPDQRKPSAANTTTSATHHIGSPTLTDRSQFYNHVPDEFRQYFPESFGHSFGRMRHQPAPAAAHQQEAHHQSPPQHHYQTPPVQPRVVHQHQQTAVHPDEFSYQKQPATPTAAARPKVCDAAIQTDILTDALVNDLNQHGLRNTVDLGQKSPAAEDAHANDRAHSAPPPQQPSQSGPYDAPDGLHSNIGTSMTPQSSTGNQYQFNYPTQSQQAALQQHSTDHQQQQQQQPPLSPAAAAAATRERSVPIVLEHRPAAAHRPAPFATNAEPQPEREAATDDATGVPPQTPHTTDCISKIQKIQTDVLDLMGSVDRFNGSRGDKDYMFIDEMLTRNLLKLDTIDTNGRESIRLARKEAIRCIQASITVLEAKAEQNANRRQQQQQNKEKAQPESAPQVPQASNDDGNIEQSLEEKLATFQRKSAEREVEAMAAASPAKHVSEVNINVNGS